MPRVNILRAVETVFATLGCFTYGTQSVQMLLGSPDQAAVGRPILVYSVFLSVYAITALFLFSDFKFIRQLLFGMPFVLLLMLMPVITIVWSVRPSDTFQRSIAGLGSGLFGLYLLWRFSLPIAVRILALSMTLAAAGSLFVALFVPTIGLMVDETWAGAWRGLYFHKNSLGAAIALATILLTYVVFTDTAFFRVCGLLGLVICLLLLIGSRSMTALFVTASGLFLMFWSRSAQKAPQLTSTMTWIGILAATAILVAVFTFASIEDAFVLLGKKAGMSGRFPLWEQVIHYVSLRPWLGYGYEAFWNETATETLLIAAVIKYTPFYSHNGALEILLTGGIVLLLILFVFLIEFLRSAWRFARFYRETFIATLPLVFLGYLILADFSESHLLMRNDLIWSLTLGLAMRLSIFRAAYNIGVSDVPQR